MRDLAVPVVFVVVVAVGALPLRSGNAVAARHLKYSSFYGFNPDAQHGWVNLGLEASLEEKLQAWEKYGLPSFYGGLPSGTEPRAIFIRGRGLAPDWEANLEALANEEILPNMKTGAIRGVFLGDEICCHNVTCWEAALAPVTAKLRALLGPDALIYTNECAEHGITEVPPDFDLISVDTYAGYAPGTKGSDEVAHAKEIFDIIFSKLHGHQQVLVVPGVFACSNLTYFPLEDQARNLVDKLDAYFDWAISDVRIAAVQPWLVQNDTPGDTIWQGFNPWHFNNRSSPRLTIDPAEHGEPCDMMLGAVAMPTVVAKLQEIGHYIVNGSSFT